MSLSSFLIVLPILIISVIVHEISHGAMALALGDKTAKNSGRLSINPIRHIDPFGSIILPLVVFAASGMFFGYAKPVPVNPMYFKDQRRGMMLTSIAGPASNFILAVIGAVFFSLSNSPIFVYFVYINVFLGVLNLIPMPPLDGSKIVAGILPKSMLKSYYKFEHYSERYIIVLFVLIWLFPNQFFGLISMVMNPILTLLGIQSV